MKSLKKKRLRKRVAPAEKGKSFIFFIWGYQFNADIYDFIYSGSDSMSVYIYAENSEIERVESGTEGEVESGKVIG